MLLLLLVLRIGSKQAKKIVQKLENDDAQMIRSSEKIHEVIFAVVFTWGSRGTLMTVKL
jgi:hypothetical protein